MIGISLDKITAKYIVEQWNELTEENEVCKDAYNEIKSDAIRLKNENEQLKSENKKLNERIGIIEGSLIDKGFDIND